MDTRQPNTRRHRSSTVIAASVEQTPGRTTTTLLIVSVTEHDVPMERDEVDDIDLEMAIAHGVPRPTRVPDLDAEVRHAQRVARTAPTARARGGVRRLVAEGADERSAA